MSTKSIYGALGIWFLAMAIIVAVGLVGGVQLTLGMMTLILVVGVTPPAVAFALFGRPAPQTVADILRQ